MWWTLYQSGWRDGWIRPSASSCSSCSCSSVGWHSITGSASGRSGRRRSRHLYPTARRQTPSRWICCSCYSSSRCSSRRPLSGRNRPHTAIPGRLGAVRTVEVDRSAPSTMTSSAPMALQAATGLPSRVASLSPVAAFARAHRNRASTTVRSTTPAISPALPTCSTSTARQPWSARW